MNFFDYNFKDNKPKKPLATKASGSSSLYGIPVPQSYKSPFIGVTNKQKDSAKNTVANKMAESVFKKTVASNPGFNPFATTNLKQPVNQVPAEQVSSRMPVQPAPVQPKQTQQKMSSGLFSAFPGNIAMDKQTGKIGGTSLFGAKKAEPEIKPKPVKVADVYALVNETGLQYEEAARYLAEKNKKEAEDAAIINRVTSEANQTEKERRANEIRLQMGLDLQGTNPDALRSIGTPGQAPAQQQEQDLEAQYNGAPTQNSNYTAQFDDQGNLVSSGGAPANMQSGTTPSPTTGTTSTNTGTQQGVDNATAANMNTPNNTADAAAQQKLESLDSMALALLTGAHDELLYGNDEAWWNQLSPVEQQKNRIKAFESVQRQSQEYYKEYQDKKSAESSAAKTKPGIMNELGIGAFEQANLTSQLNTYKQELVKPKTKAMVSLQKQLDTVKERMKSGKFNAIDDYTILFNYVKGLDDTAVRESEIATISTIAGSLGIDSSKIINYLRAGKTEAAAMLFTSDARDTLISALQSRATDYMNDLNNQKQGLVDTMNIYGIPEDYQNSWIYGGSSPTSQQSTQSSQPQAYQSQADGKYYYQVDGQIYASDEPVNFNQAGNASDSKVVDVNDAMRRIARNESQGKANNGYGAIGPEIPSGYYKGDRAIGKYQIMSKNIPSWSKEALGRSITTKEFYENPKLQDQIARHKLQEFRDKHGTWSDAASVWLTGDPLAIGKNKKDVLGTSGQEYVNKFLS